MQTYRKGDLVWIIDEFTIATVKDIRTVDGRVLYSVGGGYYEPAQLKGVR